MDSEILHAVMINMSNIVDNTCGNREIRHTKPYRDEGLISLTSLKRYVKGRSLIDPLEEALKLLERDKAIEMLDQDPITGNNKKMIKLKPGFYGYKKCLFSLI